MVTLCHRVRWSGGHVRRQEHLQLRRGRWYVRLRVPAHLVAKVGQTHVVRSLDTTDLRIAQQRRCVALAELWRWIGADTVSDGWTPAWASHPTVVNGPQDDSAHKPARPAYRKGRQRGSRASAANDDLTISTMMEKWLAEIEGVRLLGAFRREARQPRARSRGQGRL